MMRQFKIASSLLVVLFMTATIAATTLEKQVGDFLLQVSDDGGAFNIKYNPPSSSNATNFFVSHDDFASTYFSVMLDDVIYRLRRSSVSTIRLLEEEHGAGLRLGIKDKLNVNMIFSFAPQFSGDGQGAVKVEIVMENISAETRKVALKGVFDTLLGENSGVHFVTARFPYVSTESSFLDMADLQWVRSSNGNESVQFLFDGNGITSPRMVALANKDLLTGDIWTPVIKDGRTFNSVFSYNNSAVCALWEPMILTPSTSGTITFYITFASRAKIPPTAQFLGAKGSLVSGVDYDKITYSDASGVVYTVGDLTDTMLNRRYIEDLLNRIRKLEEDPEHIDRNELLRLNAELDAILEKIRRL